MSRNTLSWLVLYACCFTCHSVAVGSDPHLEKNPVYRQLIETGVEADGEAYRLPHATLCEATDAAAQQAVIEEVVHKRLRERFFRDSVVAPHVVKLESQDRADGARFRVAHFWFAAKANFDELGESDFLDSLRRKNATRGRRRGRRAREEKELF